MNTMTDRWRIFFAARYDTPRGPVQTYYCSTTDRIQAIKRSTDRTALEDALGDQELQQSVRTAIVKRLKQLPANP